MINPRWYRKPPPAPIKVKRERNLGSPGVADKKPKLEPEEDKKEDEDPVAPLICKQAGGLRMRRIGLGLWGEEGVKGDSSSTKSRKDEEEKLDSKEDEKPSYLEDEAGVREMGRKVLAKASSVWGLPLEEAAYKTTFLNNSKKTGEELKEYRKLVRLVSTNLRRPQSKHVVDRLDQGVLTCDQVMGFTPQDYQPEKHKVDLRRDLDPFNLECPDLICEQCGSSEVRRMNLCSTRDGYGKAETWGRKDSAEPTSKAQCQKCLFEWTFEPI